MHYLLFVFSLGLSFLYTYLISKYLSGWNEIEVDELHNSFNLPIVSVVIAAYNEEKNIKACLDSILKNNYPTDKFQILVVDNNSSDNTVEIIKSINDPRLKLLHQNSGHKKESLQLAFNEIQEGLILCTDADCQVGVDWIRSMVSPINDQIHMTLGPVKIGKYKNTVERFQAMDMLAMIGITAGGLQKDLTHLANGANLAFAKSKYDTLDIKGKDKASGDDVFLLQAMIEKYPDSVEFVKNKNAIVSTKAVSSWSELVQQRKRWASKAGAYDNTKDKRVNAFIFLYCLSIVINLIITPLTLGISFFIALFQLFLKATIDYAFIERINDFFNQRRLLKYFLSSFIIHFGYIIFAGLSSLFGLKYKWKGKEVER